MPDDPNRTDAAPRQVTAEPETAVKVTAAAAAAGRSETPPALTQSEVERATSEVVEAHIVDPDRRLTGSEMLKEGTRLAVGSAVEVNLTKVCALQGRARLGRSG